MEKPTETTGDYAPDFELIPFHDVARWVFGILRYQNELLSPLGQPLDAGVAIQRFTTITSLS